MTDLSPVKAMLVSALNDANFHEGRAYPGDIELEGTKIHSNYEPLYVDADRLAGTVLSGVTALVLDREKVRAALTDIINGVEIDTDHGAIGQLGGLRAYWNEPGVMRTKVRIEDDLIDRLIAALAGGQS